MSKREPEKKRRIREKLESKAQDNKAMDKNPNRAWVETNLSGKKLQIQGVPHPDPNLAWRFPLSNAYIISLPTRTRNRTGATHFVEMSTINGSERSTKMKINLKDYPVEVIDPEPTTYRGKKYVLCSLGPSVWSSVLFPIHQTIYFKERAQGGS